MSAQGVGERMINVHYYYYIHSLHRQNYFPKAFKQAKVIPIHKSGDNKDLSIYRPIYILSVLSKSLEKNILTNPFYRILKQMNLYTPTNLDLGNTTDAIPH